MTCINYVRISLKREWKIVIVLTIIYLTSFLFGFLIGKSEEVLFPQNGIFLSRLITVSFSYIATNNLIFIMRLVLGSFLLGIPTLISLIIGGINTGYTIAQSNLPIDIILILTLPHGIFEIPAIIIAGAAGFKIPYEIVRYLAGKKEQILTKEDIKEYLTLALISIILIIIAAWVEANVTLKIAKAMLNSTKGI